MNQGKGELFGADAMSAWRLDAQIEFDALFVFREGHGQVEKARLAVVARQTDQLPKALFEALGIAMDRGKTGRNRRGETFAARLQIIFKII